jgi:ABC-type Fe3+-hydroxamate transport system substrate-binding protein
MKSFCLLLISFLLFSFSYAGSIRVISLAPNVTEMIYFIGEGDKLIADTRFCDYPPEAIKLPKIGDLQSVNIEKILLLKPDLVINSFSGSSKEQSEQLQKWGLKVVTLKEERVEDILSNLVVLGQIFDRDVSPFTEKLRNKMGLAANKKVAPGAMVLISLFPFYSASTNTFLGDVLSKAGFKNVVETKIHYPLLDQETLWKLKPEFIFISDTFTNEEKNLKALFQKIGIFPRLVFVNEDRMSRPGPRAFDFILEISKYI